MNRREFAKSLAAIAAVPALPLKPLAAAPALGAVAAHPPNLYTWSKMLAKVHGQCSPRMLAGMLKVDPTIAADLCGKLVSSGAIAPANAYGVSKATASLKPHLSPQAGGQIAPTSNQANSFTKKLDLDGSLDDWLDAEPTHDVQADENSSYINDPDLMSEHDEPLPDSDSARNGPGPDRLDTPGARAPGGPSDVSASDARAQERPESSRSTS